MSLIASKWLVLIEYAMPYSLALYYGIFMFVFRDISDFVSFYISATFITHSF